MNAAHSDRPTLGILLMLGFAATGPIIDLFGKLAGETVPILQITAARFFLQALILLPIACIMRYCHRPSRTEMLLHVIRGSLMLVCTYCFFAALQYMQIAEALAIFFIEPFILTLLGGILLKESVGWRRILACIIGFMGALLVIQPKFDEVGLPALYPVGTAIGWAFYLIITRNMTRSVGGFALQTYTAIAGSLVLIPILIIADHGGFGLFDARALTNRELYLLLGVGIAGIISHFFLAFAFRYAPVTVLAPIQYLEIITAVILGFVFFHQLPNLLTVIGVLIIVGSGLFVFFREQTLSKKQTAAP